MRFRVFEPKESTAGASPRAPYCDLIRDTWDDYHLKTTFRLAVHLPGGRTVNAGDVKIMRRGQERGFTEMPGSSFTRLSEQYCSLGQSHSYYETLKRLGEDEHTAILRALRDAVFDPRIRAAFDTEPAFETSLIRSGAAARALQDAPALFHRPVTAPRTGLLLEFETSVGGRRFNIDFAFNQSEFLPDRVNAVIGYNGTGKTQLLANIATIAAADLRARREHSEEYGRIANLPDLRFGSVIAVSYSAFDTFALPDAFWASQGRLASERLDERGEVFGYVYCGLRKRSQGQRRESASPRGLKSIDEIVEEFALALEIARSKDRRPILIAVTSVVASEPSFGRIGVGAYQSASGDDWRDHFETLSTGHKLVLNVLVQVVAHIEPRSLVLVDEPESHLHPSLLAALLRALNVVLKDFDSYAIVATHSPVVLQEIPRQCVRILQRFGNRTTVRQPIDETFGENVGYLTSNIFDLDSTATDYHDVLATLSETMEMEEIEQIFGGEMSGQARAYVLSLIRSRRTR